MYAPAGKHVSLPHPRARTCVTLEIREHYTDTAGFNDHVFALMHLLGFAFCPRIRDLHNKKLFIKGKADQYPALQSLISTTSLNLKQIEIHWREVLRLATSIKQGTVTASLMLKKRVFRNLGGAFQARGLITRRLSNSNSARPYICRFSIFRRFTCPSTTPLLHLLVMASHIAAASASIPAATR